MKQSKYLSLGEKLGGHYEVVDVLGDDAFEIVYLVKDNHLGGKFFVLKELFLESIAYRDEQGNLYFSTKTDESIFNKRKKEFREEFRKDAYKGIEVYGYFEEHQTFYTIMEFLNSSNIESYLQAKSQLMVTIESEDKEVKEKIVPEVEEEEKKSKKSPVFLIGLIFLLLIFMALAYYAYKIIKEDKEKVQNRLSSTTTVEVLPATPKPMHHPPLVDREKNKTEQVGVTTLDSNLSDNKSSDKKSSDKKTSINSKIQDINETNTTQNNHVDNKSDVAYIPNSVDDKVEENKPNLNGVPKAEIYNEQEISLDIPPETEEKPLAETIPLSQTPSLDIPSSERVSPHRPSSPIASHTEGSFTEHSVANFLSRYVDALSHGSVETILSLYDRRVQKYFNLIRVTHKEIRRDKEKYNAYWAYRDFKVEGFKILKTYQENGIEYSDISVRIKWSVSTKDYKSDVGARVGSMTLKQTPNGVKIKSIY